MLDGDFSLTESLGKGIPVLAHNLPANLQQLLSPMVNYLTVTWTMVPWLTTPHYQEWPVSMFLEPMRSSGIAEMAKWGSAMETKNGGHSPFPSVQSEIRYRPFLFLHMCTHYVFVKRENERHFLNSKLWCHVFVLDEFVLWKITQDVHFT